MTRTSPRFPHKLSGKFRYLNNSLNLTLLVGDIVADSFHQSLLLGHHLVGSRVDTLTKANAASMIKEKMEKAVVALNMVTKHSLEQYFE